MNLERFIEEAKAIGLLGIMISRCGEEIAHVNLDYECRRNVYSATKSYTALAVGFAVQEGLLLHVSRHFLAIHCQDVPLPGQLIQRHRLVSFLQDDHRTLLLITQCDFIFTDGQIALDLSQGIEHITLHIHVRACHHRTCQLAQFKRARFAVQVKGTHHVVASGIAIDASVLRIKTNIRIVLEVDGTSVYLHDVPLSIEVCRRKYGNIPGRMTGRQCENNHRSKGHKSLFHNLFR